MQESGVTTETYSQKNKTAGPIILFYSSRMVAGKGFDLLVTAFAKVKNKENFKLVLGGTGPEEADVHALVQKLGLEPYVEFPDWRVNTKQKGMQLAHVSIPKVFMPGTNFSNAYMTIGASTDPKEIKSCGTIATNGEIKAGTVTINGYPFTKFTLGDAGAGNFYETTSYRGLLDGDCYAIEYTIHSTNIGAYSPDQGIKEFDKVKVTNEFESIIASFKFLVNSN
jgi:glycosyltransferase involved in cell wall biosynthesis